MLSIQNVINKYHVFKKTRKSYIQFYQFEKQYNQGVDTDLQFRNINTFDELYSFSNKQNDSLRNLVNNDCKSRFKNGSIMFVALRNNEWAAYGWIAGRGRFWFAEMDTVIDTQASSTGILYDFFTREECRGLGIYPRLLRYMIEASDFKDYLGFCYESNISSAKGMIKGGASFVGQYKHGTKATMEFFETYKMQVIGSIFKAFGLLRNKRLEL